MKKKVLFILGEDFPEKIGRFILDQILGLRENGLNVKIVALRKPKNADALIKSMPEIKKYGLIKQVHFLNVPRNIFKRYFKAIGLFISNIYRHPIKIFKTLNLFKYYKTALTLNQFYLAIYMLNRKNDFDILHGHFGQRGLMGACLKEIGIKGKLITTFYGGDISRFVENNPYAYEELFKRGDVFLVPCEDFKSRLIKLGCDKDRIRIHYIGIDQKEFNNVKRDYVNKNKIQVLSIGRLIEKKGHEYMIRVLSNIKTNNVKYTIVGEGELRGSLEKLVLELKLTEVVKFIGRIDVDRLIDFFKDADIFVMPNITPQDGDVDATSIVIIQAQASGLPVIATAHGGNSELISDGVSGYIVPEKDIQRLSEKLQILIGNHLLRKKMGEQGRINSNKFEYNNLGKNLIKIYDEVLVGK